MVIERVTIISKQAFDIFTIEYRSDGLLQIHCKGDTINLLSYKNVVEKIGEITHGKKVPILCTADEFLLPDEEVRKYMANPESNPYSLASALIIKSLSQKLVGNFFMTVLKPARPIRLFTSKDEALKWLKTFL